MRSIDKEVESTIWWFIAFLALVLLVPSIVWAGFVATKLWLWFVVPVFGLPQLHVMQAAGLLLLVKYFVYLGDTEAPTERTTEEKQKKALTSLATIVLFPAFILFVGWAYHCFL